MITGLAQRTKENAARIYAITTKDLFIALLESKKIEIQYVEGVNFLFPRTYEKKCPIVDLGSNRKMSLIESKWYLIDKKINHPNITEEEILNILIKSSEEKRKAKRKKLLELHTMRKMSELSNTDLAELIQIYIEKFENVYPFEPDFTFESTQRGYLRSIEYDNLFTAKLDIPRETRVMTETVLFQRKKAIDIVVRFQQRWKLVRDITQYTLKNIERVRNIDWEIDYDQEQI